MKWHFTLFCHCKLLWLSFLLYTRRSVLLYCAKGKLYVKGVKQHTVRIITIFSFFMLTAEFSFRLRKSVGFVEICFRLFMTTWLCPNQGFGHGSKSMGVTFKMHKSYTHCVSRCVPRFFVDGNLNFWIQNLSYNLFSLGFCRHNMLSA